MRTRDRRHYFWIGPLLLLCTALGTDAEAAGDDELLLSGRIELIDLHNFTQTIRSASVENNRFYFNNIFLNLEGPLGERSDFIVEYQPLVSELYLLGGFLTIAEALEGIDILTRGFYVQANYDLSERLKDGLRWDMFFETYDSDLLDVDLEDDLDYRFAGVYFQTTTGFVYAYNRNIDFGANLISGADEEGDRFYKVSAKIDASF